jgi:hypothetical protein
MNDFDVTGTDFHLLSAVELRKFAAKAGVKGASKGKKADLIAALETIEAAQLKAAADAAKAKPSKPKPQMEKHNPRVRRVPGKGDCTECGRKLGAEDFGGLCAADRAYAEWENAHSDEGHAEVLETGEAVTREIADSMAGCPVCHPEMDPRKPKTARRSRAGMVIVAKGTEVHKSETFRKEAEKLGWAVTVQEQTYDDGDALNTRYYANAHRGADAIQIAWDGRAYDYPSSSARLAGKDRKVRNLKEALRFLAR